MYVKRFLYEKNRMEIFTISQRAVKSIPIARIFCVKTKGIHNFFLIYEKNTCSIPKKAEQVFPIHEKITYNPCRRPWKDRALREP